MNLWIDCDDTLALYCTTPDNPECEHDGVHPYGSQFSPYVPNYALIEGIKRFRRENPSARIIVWSGGGDWYANTFVRQLLPTVWRVEVANKDHYTMLEVQEDDLVIDDMEIATKWRHFFPNKLPEELRT